MGLISALIDCCFYVLRSALPKVPIRKDFGSVCLFGSLLQPARPTHLKQSTNQPSILTSLCDSTGMPGHEPSRARRPHHCSSGPRTATPGPRSKLYVKEHPPTPLRRGVSKPEAAATAAPSTTPPLSTIRHQKSTSNIYTI